MFQNLTMHGVSCLAATLSRLYIKFYHLRVKINMTITLLFHACQNQNKILQIVKQIYLDLQIAKQIFLDIPPYLDTSIIHGVSYYSWELSDIFHIVFLPGGLIPKCGLLLFYLKLDECIERGIDRVSPKTLIF